MWKVYGIFLFVGCVSCEIFDFADVDQFAQIWQNKPSNIIKSTKECRAETKSGVKYGECISHARCLLGGGSPNGFCGILSTCCIIENSCGKTSDSKISYFEASDLPASQTTCNYNIKLRNSNICQIRLDFVKFSLAPATMTMPQYGGFDVYKCLYDVMKVEPNPYGIPDLCGINDKQHVYIHVNQSDGVTKGVQLQMSLADRNYNPQLYAPSWKIKVTQLECPGRKLFNLHNTEAQDDFPSLAPLGSVQYFTDRTGYFKNFGFDGSNIKQSYTYDQKYAIAFKRDLGVCGIKFSPDYVYMSSELQLGPWKDTYCNHYLFVPELYFDNQTQPYSSLISKVCLKENGDFRSYAPGPLYVHFNSMKTNVTTEVNKQQGFNIKYELLTKCP